VQNHRRHPPSPPKALESECESRRGRDYLGVHPACRTRPKDMQPDPRRPRNPVLPKPSLQHLRAHQEMRKRESYTWEGSEA
jgi:hypothetical protein